nr:MAG TPA: hypothetical protein [Caudoviricetes sp.]
MLTCPRTLVSPTSVTRSPLLFVPLTSRRAPPTVLRSLRMVSPSATFATTTRTTPRTAASSMLSSVPPSWTRPARPPSAWPDIAGSL